MIVFCINVKTYLIFSFLQESINSVLELSYFRGKILSIHFPGAFCEFLLLSCDFCDFYACWIELMYLFWSIICSFWNRSRSRSASSSVIDPRSFYPEQIPRVTTKLLFKWSSRPWPMIECLYLLFVLNFRLCKRCDQFSAWVNLILSGRPMTRRCNNSVSKPDP